MNNIFSKRDLRGDSVPCTPGAVPVLGHLPLIARSRFELIDQSIKTSRVAKIKLGPKTAYFINDYEDLQSVLVSDTDSYRRGVHFEKMRNMVGNGVVTTSGAEHRKQRSILMPSFSLRKLHSHVPSVKKQTFKFVQQLPVGSEWFPMGPIMALGCDIVCTNLFGEEVSEDLLDLVRRSVPVFVRNAAIQAVDVTGIYKHLPTRGNKKFKQLLSSLNVYLYEMIDSRRETGQYGEGVLADLLNTTEPETGEPLPRKEIRDQIATILLASTETTANTVAWTLYELAQHPRIAAELRNEIHNHLGGPLTAEAWSGFEIGRQDLPLLKNCIQEALRLYPSSYLLSRTTTNDIDLGGYMIPKGSEVLYSHYGQQRDPRYFLHPDEFDPYRWDERNFAEVTKEAFMPFGYGAYRCLGDNLALIEASYLVAAIVAQYDIEVVNPVAVDKLGNITLSPKGLSFMFSEIKTEMFGGGNEN